MPALQPVQGPLQGPEIILAQDRYGENPNRTIPICESMVSTADLEIYLFVI